ncbi:uncharacterized protein LOC128390862 [Panonychus citri]|uniref:uncharacterized protein LOC128390862 n=1 Tax=Panonychus citri TaxID=50023 RepID=UPI0023072481|nr:uncharacterized protein LOC128390862 [Panonychus citri]
MQYLLIVSITFLAFVTCDNGFNMDTEGLENIADALNNTVCDAKDSCQPDGHCGDGHVRNDQPVLVPIGQKEITKNQLIVLIILFGILIFDDEKTYTDCVNSCNTCKANLQSCNLDQCIPGYECKDGYKFNNENRCIPASQCPKYTCKNEPRTILTDINSFIQARAKQFDDDELEILTRLTRINFFDYDNAFQVDGPNDP